MMEILPILSGTSLLFLVLAVLPATLVGLLAALPPLRRAGRASRGGRAALSIGLGLLSFTIVLLATAWMQSRIDFVFGWVTRNDWPELVPPEVSALQSNEGAVTHELFLRDLAPLRACYSADPAICQLADLCNPYSRGWLYPDVFALAALLISAGLAGWLTRPAPAAARHGSPG